MNLLEEVYTGALHVVRLALPLLASGNGKLARGVRGRRDALARLESWGQRHRDPSLPLVWFHAPSVGEGLQARAVMEELRHLLPDAQVAFTHFSPSAESLARSVPADVADYLPLDLPGLVRRTFDALSPSLVAFSKTEVWPNVTREAARRDVPVLLLSATLPASSSRLGAVARALLGPAHRRLAHIAAISPADARRFAAFGVPVDRTSVMGDARFDQVWQRVRRPGPGSDVAMALSDSPVPRSATGDHRAPQSSGSAPADTGNADGDLARTQTSGSGPDAAHRASNRPATAPERLVIVAGSTWPADEDHMIAAYARLRAGSGSAPRLILVPHEPTEPHLARLERILSEHSLTGIRLTDFLERREDGGVPSQEDRVDRGTLPELVVVDRVGILGDLYRIAHIAYVGGGFGRAGLHSVLEPAAFGVPVLFGPRYDNSREAGELIAGGGAVAVEGTDELSGILARWSTEANARTTAGTVARRYVEQNLGAAHRGARLIIDLLHRG